MTYFAPLSWPPLRPSHLCPFSLSRNLFGGFRGRVLTTSEICERLALSYITVKPAHALSILEGNVEFPVRSVIELMVSILQASIYTYMGRILPFTTSDVL
jgi:hypothetical protein